MGVIRTFAQLQQALGLAMLMPIPEAPTAIGIAAEAAQNVLTDAFVFQYFPETLSDSQDANYANIDIPGGSHPLYQWTGGGARQIQLAANFVQERIIPPGIADITNRHSVEINSAIAMLRYYLYPEYSSTSTLRVRPPKRLWLIIPGTFLSGSLIPAISVLLTNLNVEISSWHAPGVPRIAKVDMSFVETVQSPGGGVSFIGRDSFVNRFGYTPVSMLARRTQP